MKLCIVPGDYGVARLPAMADIPDWINGPGFSAIVRSDDELTLVCAQERIPASVTAQRDWSCFRSVGPFGFDEAGILRTLIAPISDAGIGVFVLCTFDGEHIMCPQADFARAQDVLRENGHEFA